MVKSVKKIKLLIDKVMIPGYSYKTNFNCAEFLIDINDYLIIKASPKVVNNEFKYEFLLDTQFMKNNEITYDELVMIKNIIDILESNRKFVLSKFKKYTVEEFLEEERRRHEQSEKMFESLKKIIENTIRGGK